MIYFYNFYQWVPFHELIDDGRYAVTGEVMVSPDPINGNPLVHDLIIDEILCGSSFKDLTKVVSYDYIWEKVQKEII